MDEVDKILGDRCAVVLSNGHVTAAVKGSGKPKQGES
jgi:hypothetical protein